MPALQEFHDSTLYLIRAETAVKSSIEPQYQARLEDKDKVINQLISRGKVSIYYQGNSQFAGAIVDDQTVNAEQIGGQIQN